MFCDFKRCSNSPEAAETFAALIIGFGAGAASSGPLASQQRATQTIKCCFTAERKANSVPCSERKHCRLCSLLLNRNLFNDTAITTGELFNHHQTLLKLCEISSLFIFIYFLVVGGDLIQKKCASLLPLLSCLPGSVDPDDVQMTEVVAFRVQLVAASAASGPHRVSWDFQLQLFHNWTTPSYSVQGKETLCYKHSLSSEIISSF